MRPAILATLLLASMCKTAAPPAASAYDAAEKAVESRQFRQARDLYLRAAKSETDPERRSLATAHAANIEWRVMHDLEAARRTLANANDANTLIERARAEGELAHDWTTAHAFAERAVAAAKKRDERRRAALTSAEIVIVPIRDARLDRRCVPAGDLAPAIATVREVVDRDGPLLGASRLLLNAGILTNDRELILQAWRWYYGEVPDVPTDRRGLGLALAKAKFFDEAALVLADPCATHAIDDQESRDVVFYAASLRRLRDIADEYYRQVALGTADPDAFHASIVREGQTVWQRLGDGGEFMQDALVKLLSARFGTVVITGRTGGIDDMHFGHVVLDTTRTVDQYGHKATVRFVSLDGIVSNGYSTWASDGEHGDGGWNNDQGIFQVRPMYANDPLSDWRLISDPELRAERERQMIDESARDETRDPLTAPQGTRMRLRMQADEALLAELKAKGLSGDDLRNAFIERVRDDVFASSILAHEGRHNIDHTLGAKGNLEFTAKLSEVAFAPSPRRAVISGILVNIDPKSSHGIANRRIFEGLTKWMTEHANEIAGLDRSKRILAQFDKLTDDQIRAAFRSMDPLAR